MRGSLKLYFQNAVLQLHRGFEVSGRVAPLPSQEHATGAPMSPGVAPLLFWGCALCVFPWLRLCCVRFIGHSAGSTQVDVPELHSVGVLKPRTRLVQARAAELGETQKPYGRGLDNYQPYTGVVVLCSQIRVCSKM